MKKLFLILSLLVSTLVYADMESEYHRQIQQNPKNLQAHLGLISLAKSREHIAALGKEAVDMLGARSAIYIALGNAYFQIKDHNNAINSFRQAIALNPKSATIHNRLAQVLMQIGLYRQAEVSFKAAISYATVQSFKLVYYMNLVYTFEKLQEYIEVKNTLNKVLSIDSSHKAALEKLQTLQK